MNNPEETTGQRLRSLRKSNKMSGQALGDLIGLTKSSISLIESDSNKLSYDYALIISKHFNINVDWLLTGKEPKVLNKQLVEANLTPVEDLPFIELPFVPVPARASFVEMAAHPTSYGNMNTFRIYYPPKEIEGKRAFVVEVDGDSMEPQLKKGDKVLVVEVPKGDWCYQTSKVYAVAYASTFVIKRITSNTLMKDNMLTLSSDNPKGGSITISGNDIRGIWRVIKGVDTIIE